MSAKPKIVYFGVKLAKSRKVYSVIETMEPLFAEFSDIRTYSDVDNKVLRMLDMLFRFFMEGRKADTVIIDVYSTISFYYAVVLAKLCRIFRVPYVLYLHGGNLPTRYNSSQRTCHKMLANAKFNVAPSAYLQSFFAEQGYSVRFIPNIIEIEKYPYLVREKIRPRLIYLRGFSSIYNPEMTVKAVQHLKEKYPHIKLAMLGADPENAIPGIARMIDDLNLQDNIEILGKRTRDEWVSISRNYDIMVSNPIIDNTPVSIIEGMALGLSIVSTSVGGVPFLVNAGEEALLVPSGDDSALAQAIETLIEGRVSAKEMARNGRKKAESFSWSHVKPMWIDTLT